MGKDTPENYPLGMNSDDPSNTDIIFKIKIGMQWCKVCKNYYISVVWKIQKSFPMMAFNYYIWNINKIVQLLVHKNRNNCRKMVCKRKTYQRR